MGLLEEHSRPSCEGRGLKLANQKTLADYVTSPLMRGAWIETTRSPCALGPARSPLMRGAWIETRAETRFRAALRLPLMRGAWIETKTLPVYLACNSRLHWPIMTLA